MKLSNQLYLGFCIGILLAGTFFTFLIVEKFTSNEFLQQNRIYLNGKFYKLCEQRHCK